MSNRGPGARKNVSAALLGFADTSADMLVTPSIHDPATTVLIRHPAESRARGGRPGRVERGAMGIGPLHRLRSTFDTHG